MVEGWRGRGASGTDHTPDLARVQAEIAAIVDALYRAGTSARIEIGVNGRLRSVGRPTVVAELRDIPSRPADT